MPERYTPGQPYGYESPQTGRLYTSENPITGNVEANILFSEKINTLKEMRSYSDIPAILTEAGPESVTQLEEMLAAAGSSLSALLRLGGKHAAEKNQAQRCVENFFKTSTSNDKKKLVQELVDLLK